MKKIMSAETALEIYLDLEAQDIHIWLDGGWGVDGLLEEQTREHADLDIVIEEKNLKACLNYLKLKNYSEVQRDDSCAWNFVMGNQQGCEVDFHVINIRENGDGMYGPLENNCFYPANSLQGKGRINGQSVRCLTPQYQLISHSGYELKEKDLADIKRLCIKFKLTHSTFIPS